MCCREEMYNLHNLNVGLYRYDVGVYANNYYSVVLSEIQDFFKIADVDKRKYTNI